MRMWVVGVRPRRGLQTSLRAGLHQRVVAGVKVNRVYARTGGAELLELRRGRVGQCRMLLHVGAGNLATHLHQLRNIKPRRQMLKSLAHRGVGLKHIGVMPRHNLVEYLVCDLHVNS